MKRRHFLTTALIGAPLAAPAFLRPLWAQDFEEIGWIDLLPEDGTIARPVPLSEHDESGLGLLLNDGDVPLNEAVDGLNVSLTGYVTPVGFVPGSRARKVGSFLLAPFTGACVHVPPPPANQLVYVTFEEGVDLATRLSLDPIEFSGRMTVGKSNVDVTVAGYTLAATAFRYVSDERSSSSTRRYLFSSY